MGTVHARVSRGPAGTFNRDFDPFAGPVTYLKTWRTLVRRVFEFVSLLKIIICILLYVFAHICMPLDSYALISAAMYISKEKSLQIESKMLKWSTVTLTTYTIYA